MLQQTQIKTALPYFERWLAALPDFATLAAASEAEVLRLWEGLGYYSRARNLHRLARALVALPSLPRDAAAWEALPGIGPYTSAAITSISFGTPAACVDGNVVRILARLTDDRQTFRDSASAAKALTPLARAVLDVNDPGQHNQAMMELGATVCTKHAPLCTVCPVRAFCAAARAGTADELPRLAPKQIERKAVSRAWCLRDGQVLLQRVAAEARRFAGMHEFPELAAVGLAEAALPHDALRFIGRRSITRFAITESFFAVPPPEALGPNLHWVPLPDIEALTLSGPHRRWLAQLLAASPATPRT